MKITHEAYKVTEVFDHHDPFKSLAGLVYRETRLYTVDGRLVIDFGSRTYFQSEEPLFDKHEFTINKGKFKFMDGYAMHPDEEGQSWWSQSLDDKFRNIQEVKL